MSRHKTHLDPETGAPFYPLAHAQQPTAHMVYKILDAVYRANGSTLNDGEAVREAIAKTLAALTPAADPRMTLTEMASYHSSPLTPAGCSGQSAIADWLDSYSHNLMEEGDFDQEAAQLAKGAAEIRRLVSQVERENAAQGAIYHYLALFDRCGGSTAVSAEAFANARQRMRDAIGAPDNLFPLPSSSNPSTVRAPE